MTAETRRLEFFPLEVGSPARVGRLRGYGNGLVAPQAEAFVRAYNDNATLRANCVGCKGFEERPHKVASPNAPEFWWEAKTTDKKE